MGITEADHLRIMGNLAANKPKIRASSKSLAEDHLARLLDELVDAGRLPQYQRQVRVVPDRRWAWDFAFGSPHRLCVDIQGGTWTQGRHSRGEGYRKDTRKWWAATMLGWHVLICTTEDVMDGTTLFNIREWFAVHGNCHAEPCRACGGR